MSEHLITFGHGAGDTGTTYKGLTERDEIRKLKGPLEKWAKKSKHKFTFYNGNMYADRSISKQKKFASVTELHLDGPKGDGGHVIISSKYKPDAADKRLKDVIKKRFGIVGYLQKADGFSYRSDLYNLNVAATNGITYRLLELFFLSNDADRKYYRDNIDVIARDIIQGITGESFGETSVDKITPSTKLTFDQVVKNTYRGDYGNGEDRVKGVQATGHNYAQVQKEVNKRYY